MKHKFLIITLSLLLALLCSCNQGQGQELKPLKPLPKRITASELNEGEIETGTVAGDYIYHSDYHILIKYHIPSGTATTVCQDPFCEHDLHCPFRISGNGYAAMGNILYYANEIDGQWRLRSYDGDSMQIQEIRVSDGVINRLFTYNYYLYFSESEAVDGSLINSVVYRWDTQSDAFDVIDCGYSHARIYKIEVGRIIWEKGDEYISTDLNGEDEREYNNILQREWGNYKYRWMLLSGGSVALYRKDLSTNQEILLADSLDDFYFYGDKILYWEKTESPRVVATKNGKQIIDNWGGNVYVMNSDGSNKHQICHVEDFYYGGLSTRRNNEYVCGDWVGMISQNYYEDENGNVNLCLSDMLFVNVVTGEYKFIKYNPYE